MSKRSAFPPVFWIANSIEILERIAYYGIYMGFGGYMNYLGYSKDQLGIVQSIFLFLSYSIPIFSGTFADKYGFKRVLIVSYLAYLPSILLLLITKSFSGIALTMLCIGFAAGIFKPLISGTVRVVTDGTNKTLGFGIFYAMVNIGGTVGPLIAGKLRIISYDYAFLASVISIAIMLVFTVFFYKEPPREIEGQTLKKKFNDLGIALGDIKFALFLVILGLFFWLPFWSFFNVIVEYVDKSLDTARLYVSLKGILGSTIADFISKPDKDGIRRIWGESIGNSGLYIICFQLMVSNLSKRFKALPTFLSGLFVASLGFIVIASARILNPSLIFLGIFLFAVGEMMASPRIQEYITWMAPKEKAGLYIGANFLATCIGGLCSGLYTSLSGYYIRIDHPEYIWYTLGLNMIMGIIIIYLFTKAVGGFKEMEA